MRGPELTPQGARSDHYNDHVARQLTATEARTRFHSLIADVSRGEVIEITRRGRVIARMSPARGAPALEGVFKGVARSTAIDDELFCSDELWECSDQSERTSEGRTPHT